MFGTITKRLTSRTGLGCIGWININHSYTFSFGLILNKLAKLIKGPAMQSTAHPLIALNPDSNVLQILQDDFSTIVPYRFCDDLLGHTVIYIFYMPPLFARDLPQSLFSRLRTVALKTASMCQEFIALTFKCTPSNEFAGRSSYQVILSKIDSKYFLKSDLLCIRNIEYQIKEPSIPNLYKFCFLWDTFQEILSARAYEIRSCRFSRQQL